MGRLGIAVGLAVLAIAVAGWLWWQNAALRDEVADVRAGERAMARTPPAAGRTHTATDAVQAVNGLLPTADGTRPSAAPDWQRWASDFFLPQAGENLLDYRDRMLPVLRAVMTPQRERVTTWRRRFETEARLTEAQKRTLDAVVGQAGDELKDRIMNAVLSGELDPATLKPSRVVAFSRDLLQLGDQANQRFRATLAPDQIAAYDGSRFDVVDYLVFSTRWEDLLFVTE